MSEDCNMTITYGQDFTPSIEVTGVNAEAFCKQGTIQLRKSPTGILVKEEPCTYMQTVDRKLRLPGGFYCGMFSCPLNSDSYSGYNQLAGRRFA